MTAWDDAAAWYLDMVRDPTVGFNHLAIDLAVQLLADVEDADILDIGAGEGSLARRLATDGARVVAAEPTELLRDAAIDAERREPLGIRVVDDHAEQLASVATASVDAVAALLVMHHVAALDRALAEARRVLRPRGALVLIVPHPWSRHPGSSWLGDDAGVERLSIGQYSVEGPWSSTEGVAAIGWHHRTVATWLSDIARAGFVIDDVGEPLGAEPRRPDGGGRWAKVPVFLTIRARSA